MLFLEDTRDAFLTDVMALSVVGIERSGTIKKLQIRVAYVSKRF